ncbi:MAG: nucleotidyltransferase domain-containing protein [Chitinophagaceae bacterium]|nr:nucleotidyltransferase domain-containing protein [Chitinophagaceae bacterium]
MLQNIDRISPLPQEVICFLTSLTTNNVIDRMIVFGSRAIGDYEKYSDLDLAIDAPKMSKLEWQKLKEYVTYDLRTVLRISLVYYSTNPPKLKERIKTTGTIIYGRQS